jgi:hypothetical protein
MSVDVQIKWLTSTKRRRPFAFPNWNSHMTLGHIYQNVVRTDVTMSNKMSMKKLEPLASDVRINTIY